MKKNVLINKTLLIVFTVNFHSAIRFVIFFILFRFAERDHKKNGSLALFFFGWVRFYKSDFIHPYQHTNQIVYRLVNSECFFFFQTFHTLNAILIFGKQSIYWKSIVFINFILFLFSSSFIFKLRETKRL